MKFVQMVSSADSLTSNTNRLWTIFYCNCTFCMFHIEQCRIARTNRTKLWAETSEQAECEQAECIVYIVYQIWTSRIPNLHQSSTSALATEMNSIPCVKPIALHQTLYIMINLNAVGHLSQMAKLTLFKVCVEYYFMEGDWNINLNSTPKQWIVQISRYLPKNLGAPISPKI